MSYIKAAKPNQPARIEPPLSKPHQTAAEYRTGRTEPPGRTTTQTEPNQTKPSRNTTMTWENVSYCVLMCSITSSPPPMNEIDFTMSHSKYVHVFFCLSLLLQMPTPLRHTKNVPLQICPNEAQPL